MLVIGGSAKIYLYREKVDMRKSFEGLSEAVESTYPHQLLTGSLFTFLNKRGDRMKILYWDHDGLVIWYKRLEQGTFASKMSGQIDKRSFLMLLEGVTPKRLQKRWNSL